MHVKAALILERFAYPFFFSFLLFSLFVYYLSSTMQRECAVDDRVNAAPKRGGLSEELHAHRFSTALAPIKTKSPTSPPFRNTLMTVCALPELPSLCPIKPNSSSSNTVTTSVNDNGASVTVNRLSGTDRTLPAAPTSTASRREQLRLPSSFPNKVCGTAAAAPPLAALPVQSSQPISLVNRSGRAASPPPPIIRSNVDTSANDATVATATSATSGWSFGGSHAPFALRESTLQPSRRTAFVLNTHGEAGDLACAPAVAAPELRHRRALTHRGDPVLHSELGMYQLEHLDSGGKLQQRLTSFYHYCTEELTSAEDDTEGVPANHPCPFLPESRQFREYVMGDIDRSYGVVNTAVTLSAKEEQPALPVGSVASDNGTETVTLTCTVVNAVKESEASSSSKVRESYQPLPGTVFESALCKAWVWKQKSRAEASYAVEAAAAAVMNSSSLPSLSLRSFLLSTLSPIVTSTILAEVSLAASVARGGNLPNPSEPKALAAKPSVHIPVNGNSASNATSCLLNASLPTFKARVNAGLQMGDMYDPHAPLTALQLAVCELCGAELVCRKTLWTSFLAERYELLVALVETSAFDDCITNVVPLPGAFAVMLERNSAAMQRYFSLTLEQYLPWMADLYLAEYKPVLAPATKPKTDGATGTSSATRRFHSVVRPPSSGAAAAAAAALLDRRPAALKPLPNMKSFLKTCKSSRPSFSPPPSAQPTLVGASVLMKVSFIVLEELAIVARMQLPAVVANAMNLLMPGAASLTRDSLFTSFTQSASLATVSDSTPMAGRVHEMSATAHSGSGTVASNGCGSSSGDGLLIAATGTVSDSASAYARTADSVATAAAAKEANSAALLQSRLLHHWSQLNRVSDAQPVLSDELLKTSEAGADTTQMSLAAAPALAALKAVRRRSSYERSRVWLKVLFKFFHGEQAYSFVSDSPIAMRNFLPLPHVSWERILLRSFTIVAWTEFHASVAASAASLWGFRERTRGSWQKSIPMWEQDQWDRALRNCEQEALNMAAAIHELWFLIREWWLQFMENVFRSTAPVALTPRAGSNGNNKRRSKAPCAASTTAAAPGVTPWPLCSTEAAMNPPTSLTMDADPGLVSIPRGTSASQNPAPRFPQERETLCGSLPSVPSSVEKLCSSSVTPSKTAGGLVAQLTLAPQVRPAPKRLDNTEAPRQLQPGSSSSLSGHSSDFLLSTRSVTNSESQPIPTNKERRSLAGQHQQQQTRLEKGRGATALPGIRLQTSGFVTLDQHKGQYGDAAADLAVNTSRLLVPPMTATISGFYKGHAADWDTVLLVRCESLTRAALAEQEAFERQLLRRMRNAGAASLDTCGAMEARIAAEEDVWLIHRRNTARYLWDQVAMEKHLHLRSWVLERAQMSFISTAVLSHESLAELQLDTRIRLEEDFNLLIRETRSWGPPIVAAAAASAQLLQQLPWSQMQHKLRTAAMALGSSNANSIPDEMSVAERRVFLKGKTDSKLMQAWETARGSMNKTFHFWGYGAFLPRADSPVGFNDGLVVMSRLCRDMRLRGRRLRTHWIVDVGNDEDDEPSLNFNDIHYANHDTYTGFTYVQLSGAPVQDEQAESVPEEVHTPRKRVNSLTDIHREGEDGAGQLLRHGLGNYASKTGYTYVGGWHMDCPHGDGGLLFNGVLPWASCSEMGKKSLLLIFGRWEHGSLAQVELMFSGVPLS